MNDFDDRNGRIKGYIEIFSSGINLEEVLAQNEDVKGENFRARNRGEILTAYDIYRYCVEVDTYLEEKRNVPTLNLK